MDGYAVWGSASLISSSGSIRFGEGVKCGDLVARTSSGSINLGDSDAETVNLSSSSGSLRLGELRVSGDISLKTTSGGINSDDITAENVIMQSSSGSIRIGDVSAGGRIDITTTSGSQNTGYVKSGGIYAISSSSGSLRYGGLSGAGSVNSTSASFTCGSLDVKGGVSLTSSSGNQRLELSPSQNFEIKIRSSSGNISASDDIVLYYADRQGKSAFGTVGDGSGGELDIRSTSGSIIIG